MPLSAWNPDWNKAFPFFDAEESALQTMLSQLQAIEVAAHSTVFQPGAPCQHYLMVLEGSIKVTLTSITGREVVLYRVSKGETCILTTSCLLASETYSATGTTESDVSALVLSQKNFDKCLSTSDAFRQFVFTSLGQRFTNLINRIEQVNFGTIDARLAEALLTHAEVSPLIRITHQDLANELGTAREVISRHLKQFETHRWVQLHRGSINVEQSEALHKLVRAG